MEHSSALFDKDQAKSNVARPSGYTRNPLLRRPTARGPPSGCGYVCRIAFTTRTVPSN